MEGFDGNYLLIFIVGIYINNNYLFEYIFMLRLFILWYLPDGELETSLVSTGSYKLSLYTVGYRSTLKLPLATVDNRLMP